MRKFILFIVLSFLLNSNAQRKWTTDSAHEYQKNLDKEYSDPKVSPLRKADLKTFKGLDFFPVSAKYAVTAHFTKSKNEKIFGMKTTGTRMPKYVKYGELHFTLDRKKIKLNVYQNIEVTKKSGYEDYLFLPFSDLTSGKESYIGGRYLDMRIPDSNIVLLDFNTAYNPYCAYNHEYSCPLVPLENDLDIEILAGVKKFHD